MHTIEVSDDIYNYLLSKVKGFNESPTQVLMRELGLGSSPAETSRPVQHGLSTILTDPRLQLQTSSKEKFLFLLSEVFRMRGKDFDKLLGFKGSRRKYFARKPEDITKTSETADPRQIPGTPYWVVTNASNRQKAKMLRIALGILGYDSAAAREAGQAIL